MKSASFNVEIKMLQLHCIFFEDEFFKLVKVKGDESCLYWAVASQCMLGCRCDVWTDRIPHRKKPGIKLAPYEVVNDLKKFISQKENYLLQKLLADMPIKKLMILPKKR